MTSAGSWHLTESVTALAARAEGARDAQLARTARRCSQRLGSPLRVAVVGRVKTGKSTLLNGLLGTAVAPTDAGECTRVVYQFRHGQHTTAELVTRTGRRPLHFTGSRLPSRLGLPAADVRYVDVTMSAPPLKKATLIDTPGLASVNSDISDVTTRMMLDTNESAAHADALLYCVQGALQQDEDAAVRSFRRGTGARRLSAVTAIGVLTRADQFGDDPRTAWGLACDMARTMTERHADLFAAVVPVVGLLAETAGTGALRERHAGALGELAAAWTPDVQDIALIGHETFLAEPGPVDVPMRRELLALFGLYGLHEALTSLRAGTPAEAAKLTALASALSGIDEVHRQLGVSLYQHAGLLKAAAVLDELQQAALRAGDGELSDDAQRMLDEPAMFPLRLVELAQLMAAGDVKLPPRLRDEVRLAVQIGLGRPTPEQVVRAIGEWRRFEDITDANGRRVARVMQRAWQLAVHKESR